MQSKNMARRWSRTGRPGWAGRPQRGYLLLELSLALIITALSAYSALQASTRADLLQTADVEADNLALYQAALQNYTDEWYPNLQSDLPITKNGVTVPVGAGVGQTLQPTVAQLIGMGYLNAGFTNTTILVDGGTYQNKIQKMPAGCVASACNIFGLAYIDKPFLIRGTTNQTNGPVLGEIINRLGGNGGMSIEGSVAQVTGAGAAWSAPNPLAGNPAGVIGERFGTSTFNAYLRVNDTRDPNFQGPMTVAGATTLNGATTINNTLTAGNTTVNGNLSVTGTSNLAAVNLTGPLNSTGQIQSSGSIGSSNAGGCLRASLNPDGSIVSKDAGCATHSTLDNNGLSVGDGTGVNRITANGNTGLLAVNNAVGSQVIGADGSTGRLTTQTLNLASAAAAGGACATPGDVASDSAAGGTVLVCRSGFWRSPGLAMQTAGTPCATAGQLAQTSTNQALICRAGSWYLLNDRVSAAIAMDLWSGNGTGAVAAPACGVGGTPDIAVAALQGGADYGGVPPRNRFEFRVTGGGPWTVTPVMVDDSGGAYGTSFGGTPYNFGWTATTYCKYAG